MKKLTDKYKKRLLYADRREITKRQSDNIRNDKKQTKTICLPPTMTLQEKKGHTALCKAINNIKRWVKSCEIHRVILDFSRVDTITPEGMLLFFAELDVINRLRGKTIFTVKPPLNRRCAQVLRKIGFYELLGKKQPQYPEISDETVVHWVVLQNTNTEPVGWEILMKQTGDIGLYTPVTEAIDNSISHGYSGSRDDFFCCKKAFAEGQKWWMFSQRKDEELHIALADLGIGFSKSLKEQDLSRNKSVKRKLSEIFGKKPWTDDEVIKAVVDAALEGEHTVTSTGAAHRGKGIAQICHLAQTTPRSRLWIWSNRGGYCIKRGQSMLHSQAPKSGVQVKFPFSINGTILYWSIPTGGEA